MPLRFSVFAVLIGLCTVPAAFAQEASGRQNHGLLRESAERFLLAQAAGLPGSAAVSVGAIDPRLALPACTAPDAFFPAGSRAWGKTTVGIRCTAPSAWTVYVPAAVRVQGEYLVAAGPLAPGRKLAIHDVARAHGDLTTLPAGIITDAAQAVGRSVSVPVAAGAPLRQETLRAEQAVQQGQMVRVMSSGSGFRVSTDARALNNAFEGQVAQARTPGGQVVSGIARAGGIVEVTH